MAGFRRNGEEEIQGYILEPEYTEEELRMMDVAGAAGGEGDARGNAEDNNVVVNDRIGHTDWCQCDVCVIMPTQKESLCCNEDSANVVDKLYDHAMECITTHETFRSICLTPAVLEMLMYWLREIRGYGQQREWQNR